MNTPTPTSIPPAVVAATDSDNVQIALAFSAPRGRPFLFALGAEQPLMLFVIGKSLELVLQRSGILVENVLPHGDLCDGLIHFQTTDRKAALEIVFEHAEKLSGYLSLASIAWFDAGEEQWRIVQHGVNPVQFEELMSTERFASRGAIMEQTVSLLTHLLETYRNSHP